MNDSLFESLLYQEESESLDFKSGQYKFENANDKSKSELLKDILAFANSWRSIDAHILIGVQEKKGARSKVQGVSSHLLNRNLQQFVDSKINKPLKFSYKRYSYENSDIGIITIPRQERPFYIKKDYGKLKAEKVYIRRSDTTAIASPDEIARMGKAIVSKSIKEPDLKLRFANLNKRKLLGTYLEIECDNFIYDKSLLIPDYQEKPGYNLGISSYVNNDYYRDIAKYIDKTGHLSKYGLVIENNSENLAENVLVTIDSKNRNGLNICDEEHYPSTPSLNPMLNFNFKNPLQNRPTPSIEVSRHANAWHLESNFGNVQPGNKIWSKEAFYIGTLESTKVDLNAKIVANNLKKPITLTLNISFEVNKQKMDFDMVKAFMASIINS